MANREPIGGPIGGANRGPIGEGGTFSKNRISLFESRNSLLANRISLLENRIPLLENRISLFESRISLLETRISLFENRVCPLRYTEILTGTLQNVFWP